MKRIDPSQQVINLAAALHEMHEAGPMDSTDAKRAILASIEKICEAEWLGEISVINVPSGSGLLDDFNFAP